MPKVQTRKWDAARYLKSDEDVRLYLQEAFEQAGDDLHIITKALGTVARARGGMARLAQETGLNREALYRALDETGNPTLETLTKVLGAFGVRLSIDDGTGRAA